MDNEALINGIKKVLMGDSDVIFTCTNCGEDFDITRLEDFVKHQLDERHFDYEKIHK